MEPNLPTSSEPQSEFPSEENFTHFPKKRIPIIIILLLIFVILLILILAFSRIKAKKTDQNLSPSQTIVVTPTIFLESGMVSPDPTLDPETLPLPSIDDSSKDLVDYFNSDGSVIIDFYDKANTFTDQNPDSQSCKSFRDANYPKSLDEIAVIAKIPNEDVKGIVISYTGSVNSFTQVCEQGADRSLYMQELNQLKGTRIILERIFNQIGFR